MRERKYDDAGFTPEERLRERQSLETKGLLIELRSLLESELSKNSEFRSQYYTEALNYLKKFWKELFAFLDDGELPIDNNLTEQTIRKLTPNVTTRSIMAAISVLRWRRPTIA